MEVNMKLIDKAIEIEQSQCNPWARNKEQIIRDLCPDDYGISKFVYCECPDGKDCRECWNQEYEEE
jgi:hypothetical protein